MQTDGRLVRLERHQGEYWVLTLMLAGLKTQWSRCMQRSAEPWRFDAGFFAEQLHAVLGKLPPWLWSSQRAKRGYVNQVLARAECDSDYLSARKLWRCTRRGVYLPDPQMLLRAGEGWMPVYEVFALQWIDRGCASAAVGATPRERIEQLLAGVTLSDDDVERVSPDGRNG